MKATGRKRPFPPSWTRHSQALRFPCCGPPALAGLLLLAAGCAVFMPWQQENADTLVHHNWWNFYARGLERMKLDRWADAQADFESALGVQGGARFGYAQDQWRARTYGMHFLEDYFPNRELGICLYRQGQLDGAETYLKRSLEQEPSGRAKHFLNLARKELVSRKSMPPPVVEIRREARDPWTARRSRMLQGRATGAGFVDQVLVQAQAQFIELAEPTIDFAQEVPLKPGTNQLAVVARDLAGRATTQVLQLVADWQPPDLLITNVTRQPQGWSVQGVVCDDQALAKLEIPGAGRIPQVTGRRALPVAFSLAGPDPAMVQAEDAAGNRMQAQINPDDLQADWVAAGAAAGWLAVAGPGAGIPVGTTDLPPALDRMKPTLALSLSGEIIEVHDEEFYLEGTARDPGKLAGVFINGENQVPGEFERQACQYAFDRRIPLDLGSNVFEIVAQDCAGNEQRRQITIVRREPEYLLADYRLTAGLPPPTLRSAHSSVDAAQIKDLMVDALVAEPVRFRLLERDVGWDYILRELELNSSVLADNSSAAALRIGKMLPAEMLFMTVLRPDPEGVTIRSEVVESGDGEVLLSENVYSVFGTDDLADKVAGLVMKIEQRFPLVESRVAAMENGKAALNTGTEHGLRPGAQLIVIEPGPGHGAALADGAVRKMGSDPIKLCVARTGKGKSQADVVPPEAKTLVHIGDYAVAR